MFVSLETMTLNATARREFGRDGREYLVAPVSMLVPGVLPGSKGALLYPPEEVARNVTAWEGAPLTVGHPYIGGQPVSAKHASVRHVGTVRAPSVRNGSLRAEAWFDVAALRYEAPALLQRLERGERVEVSTGLYTDNEPAPAGASHKGRAYEFVARNYRPDHLAILPDQQGACSLRDGCGVNNQDSTADQFARQSADMLAYQPPHRETIMNSACDCVTNREPMPDVTNADAAPSGIDHFFFLDTPNAVRPRSARVPDAPRRVVVNSLSPRERADVMPLPEAVSELTLNDDALNAVLFGNNWASG